MQRYGKNLNFPNKSKWILFKFIHLRKGRGENSKLTPLHSDCESFGGYPQIKFLSCRHAIAILPLLICRMGSGAKFSMWSLISSISSWVWVGVGSCLGMIKAGFMQKLDFSPLFFIDFSIFRYLFFLFEKYPAQNFL